MGLLVTMLGGATYYATMSSSLETPNPDEDLSHLNGSPATLPLESDQIHAAYGSADDLLLTFEQEYIETQHSSQDFPLIESAPLPCLIYDWLVFTELQTVGVTARKEVGQCVYIYTKATVTDEAGAAVDQVTMEIQDKASLRVLIRRVETEDRAGGFVVTEDSFDLETGTHRFSKRIVLEDQPDSWTLVTPPSSPK